MKKAVLLSAFWLWASMVICGLVLPIACRDPETNQAPFDGYSLNAEGARALHAGDFVRAETYALEVYRRTLDRLGPKETETLEALHQLATLKLLRGQVARAQYIDALVLRQLAFLDEENIPIRLSSYNNLGLTFRTQGRYAESILFFREALALSEELLGAEHLHTIMMRNNLATTYTASGQQARADSLLGPQRVRLLKIREQSGELHYLRATLNNLVYNFLSTGCYAEAEPLYNEARSAVSLTWREAEEDPKRPIIFIGQSGRDFQSQDIDCSMFTFGSNGPFNPDPSTGGDMALCAQFGTGSVFGIWDWGIDGGGPCAFCPPCTFCTGGGGGNWPDPDPDPTQPKECAVTDTLCLLTELIQGCNECKMREVADHEACLFNPVPGSPITPAPNPNPNPSPPGPITVPGIVDVIAMTDGLLPLDDANSVPHHPPNILSPAFDKCMEEADEAREECDNEVSRRTHGLTCDSVLQL